MSGNRFVHLEVESHIVEELCSCPSLTFVYDTGVLYTVSVHIQYAACSTWEFALILSAYLGTDAVFHHLSTCLYAKNNTKHIQNTTHAAKTNFSNSSLSRSVPAKPNDLSR